LARIDRKYVVPVDDALALAAGVRSETLVLEIDGLRAFRYETVSFDTPGLDAYLAAARSRPQRAKVRTRTYLDSGLCMLEAKVRDRRGATVKHRLPHPFEERRALGGGGIAFLETIPEVAGLLPGLRPVSITRFRRTTLFDPPAGARATIDTGLECEAFDGRRVEVPHLAVIETKSPGPPTPIDRLLWAAHHRPAKISKYCTTLAALDPALPANKWNRTLRTHFGWRPDRPATAAPA
jgi:hypothetical protein